MMTFSRHRTPNEIRKLCDERGFPYSQGQFDRGSDHVSFMFRYRTITLKVCYNTVNGCAFGEFWRGEHGERTWFTTRGVQHESRPWFKALLAFIYVP
jgi:hypothetical protein